MISHGLTARLQHFFCGSAGSVLVESAFIFTVLVTLSVGAIDYCGFIVKKGRTENLSYSLGSVFRERKHLYSDREEITQAEVDQLAELAATLMTQSDRTRFCLSVEVITFNAGEKKQIKQYRQYNSKGPGCGKARPKQLLSSLQDLSPWSIRGRWVPLYQVTLTLPVQGNALQTINVLPGEIVASSVLVRR